MSWKLRAAVSALLLAPQAVLALGLGDVRLNSALNEPLSAEIELVAPTTEELNSLTAELASREMFQRYGLDRPRYLDSLQFRVGRGADGRNVLLVNSAAPISEPFVTFLVEVNWPRGRLLREYTVLLDPPVFAPAEATPPAPVAAPRVSRPAPAVPAPAPAPAPAARRPEPAQVAPAGDLPSSYRVQRGDTLYGIASQYSEGSRSATNRMMIAMFRANPDAFSGNINLLRAGAILRVPGPDALDSVSASEAASEIGRQTTAWRSGAGAPEEGRLRLVTPTEAAPETPAPEARATDVPSRIEQLNREIAESQRLLELKSAELAQLQQQLSDREAAAAEAAAAEAAAAQAAAAEAAAEAEVETPVDEAPVAEEAAPQAEPQAAEPAPAPVTEAEPSFFDKLSDNLAYVLGAAVLLLGGGLAFGYARRRREEDLDEALRSFEPPAGAPIPSETQRLRALAVPPAAAAMETATSDEDDEASARADRMAEREPEFDASRPSLSPDETLSAEAPLDLDQGDALAEADFHMAYGLYDQAADIVKLALDKEPGRRDYKLKLAEIFFVAGNKPGFLEAAREFEATRSDGDAAEWDRLVIMGRQIAPDDPLFEGAAASGSVDLNLEGGDSRVDLELLAPPEGEEGIDLDLGEALAASDSSADTGESELIDFDFDAADKAESPTAEMSEVEVDLPTRHMPALGTEPPTAEMPKLGESTAEMPTVEVPAGDSPTVEATRLQPPPDDTLRQKIDSSAFAADIGAGDATAEMPMDDLGIDLGDLDAFAEGPPEDDVTRIAPSADTTRMMDSSIDEADVGTSELPVLKEDGGDMDFDLSDISPEVAAAGAATDVEETQRIDLDVGPVIADGEDEFTATEQMALSDLPEMSELEPVTMSEVGTKLDLARAYVDMGDPDGARSILQEVLKEGSASQKRDAQGLLDSLPGE